MPCAAIPTANPRARKSAMPIRFISGVTMIAPMMPVGTAATAVSDGSACNDSLMPIATPAVTDFGASDKATSSGSRRETSPPSPPRRSRAPPRRRCRASDQIELLHDADAGRDKQQRQMREQAAAGIFHAILLQRPARQRNEAVTRQQQQQQKQPADHRTRHRQAEPAHDDLPGQLTQQNKAEARYHSLSARGKLPHQAIPANATAAYHHPGRLAI